MTAPKKASSPQARSFGHCVNRTLCGPATVPWTLGSYLWGYSPLNTSEGPVCFGSETCQMQGASWAPHVGVCSAYASDPGVVPGPWELESPGGVGHV